MYSLWRLKITQASNSKSHLIADQNIDRKKGHILPLLQHDSLSIKNYFLAASFAAGAASLATFGTHVPPL
jgi:hypothetical protein